MKKSKGTQSKRAEILNRVLKHINAGNYDEEGRYMVFGARSVWDMMMDLTDPANAREDHSLEDAVEEAVSEGKAHTGTTEAARRTSLDEQGPFSTEAFNSLSPDQLNALRGLIQEHLKKRAQGPGICKSSESTTIDCLDGAFAEEVLGKLEKIIPRVLGLDAVKHNPRLSREVKDYFDEAHRCYLYGFHVACAVLCRAVLEEALKRRVDPKNQILNDLPKGGSYFKALVDAASGNGLLGPPLPQWADKVKRSGDQAIHDLKRFRAEQGGESLDDVLLKTRRILYDLYARHG